MWPLPKTMQINDLTLPAAYLADIENGKLHLAPKHCPLKNNLNAFGDSTETELDVCFGDAQTIAEETATLQQDFEITFEEAADFDADHEFWPGEIPLITDFSRVLCFARAADGAPFCFDYRENPDEPSVFWWADAYWQRVAPNYASFVELFDLPATDYQALDET